MIQAATLDPKYSLTLKSTAVTSSLSTSSERGTKRKRIWSHRPVHYSTLKLMIFDFDATLQYLPLEEHVSGHLHNLELMHILDFLLIFGGRDRINRLKEHFQKLKSMKIRIGLYIPRNDVHYGEIVELALKKAYLYSYFDFVVDPYSIHGLAIKHKLKNEEVLLVTVPDGSMVSFQVYQCAERYGVSLHDLESIENGLGLEVQMLTHFGIKILPHFLSSQNYRLYKDLRLQIARYHFYDGKGVDSLDAIKFIKGNAALAGNVKSWIAFAEKYMLMIYHSHKHHEWTALAVLETLEQVCFFSFFLSLSPFSFVWQCRACVV